MRSNAPDRAANPPTRPPITAMITYNNDLLGSENKFATRTDKSEEVSESKSQALNIQSIAIEQNPAKKSVFDFSK